jgi:hypothetical protein
MFNCTMGRTLYFIVQRPPTNVIWAVRFVYGFMTRGMVGLQMGGKEGVYSKEVSRITVAVRGGLKIHFYPRLQEA